jgi:hypothetical protein
MGIGVVLAVVGTVQPLPVPSYAGNTPAALDVMAEFQRIASSDLWPGFEPRATPLALYDGQRTWLFHHPAPPPEFAPLPGHPGVSVFEGQHAALRANTSAELGGLLTATFLLKGARSASVTDLAAGGVHETFHVFERLHHETWTANEVDLFVYPVDRDTLLQLRRLEAEALRRALAARGREESAAWAGEAVRARGERFRRMPAACAAYERGNELNEGLAQYVEMRAAGRTADAVMPATEFPPEEVRQRTYASGQALALLLDRLDPHWKPRLESNEPASLDELLGAALDSVGGVASPAASGAGGRGTILGFSETERAAALQRASADVDSLQARRSRARSEFLARPGWELRVVVDGGEPLWPQHFDPLNVRGLAGGEVLHSRWLQLGNSAGQVEVLDHASLTVPAGRHPLFEGVRELVVTGLASEPEVRATADSLAVRAPGVRLAMRGARLERGVRSLYVRLGSRAPAR